MGYANQITLLASSGYAGRGIGLPVLIGSNRTLDLQISALDALAVSATTVIVETSAYAVRDENERYSITWRQLGSTVELIGPGSASLSLTGADAFVRVRYAINAEPSALWVHFSVSGQARCVLVAAAARSGAGVSATVDIEQYHGGRFAANVTSAPGSGQTLTLTIERSEDGQSGWTTAATFASIAAVGEYAVESADLDRFVRVRWTPSGGGSWTFGVQGRTSLIFARPRDRALTGIRRAAIPDISPAQYLPFLETATATMIGSYKVFVHPLRAWDEDTRQCCIILADWLALNSRSKDPVRPEDGGSAYLAEAERMNVWLAQVGGYERGNRGSGIRPANVIDSSPPTRDGMRSVYAFQSDTPRQTGRRLVW